MFAGADAKNPGATEGITNSKAAPLVTYTATQVPIEPNADSTLTISFEPVNALPETGSIEISYPQKLTFNDGDNTVCYVYTTQ